jgi:hypothetical protein
MDSLAIRQESSDVSWHYDDEAMFFTSRWAILDQQLA